MLTNAADGKKECCNLDMIVSDIYGQLLNYLKKHTGENVIAADIAQDVMLKLVRAHVDNHLLANPRAWLFEVARNQLADHYREKKEESFINGDLPDDAASIHDNLTEPGPQDLLPQMLKLLPPIYGEPLAMSDLYHYQAKKIAAELGISLAAAKMRVRRARKMLLDLFYDCCEIEFSKSGAFAGCTVKDSCRPLTGESRGFRHR